MNTEKVITVRMSDDNKYYLYIDNIKIYINNKHQKGFKTLKSAFNAVIFINN